MALFYSVDVYVTGPDELETVADALETQIETIDDSKTIWLYAIKPVFKLYPDRVARDRSTCIGILITEA